MRNQKIKSLYNEMVTNSSRGVSNGSRYKKKGANNDFLGFKVD